MLMWIIFILHLVLPDSFGYENLALNKNAQQSSQWPGADTPASKAVDGTISQFWPNLAVTDLQPTVWWYVDLGSPRNIYKITIYYRTENNPAAYRSRFAGFSLYISNTNYTEKGGYKCSSDNTNPPIIYSTVCTHTGRYVTIYNQRSTSPGAMLELGEVQVFGCPNATVYGSNCENQCSNKCKNSWCNAVIGYCNSCPEGYNSYLCDKVCSAGHYGQSCRYNCSNNCVDPLSCDHVDGSCVGGCKPGWKGNRCDENCEDWKYGQDYREDCGNCQTLPCNKNTGICDGCVVGYYPPLCKTPCAPGRYGENCTLRCGNCKNGTACKRVSGHCESGCGPGYTGQLCKTDCEDGKYGQDCREDCGNCQTLPCNKNTGICDGCVFGYYPPLCKTRYLVKANDLFLDNYKRGYLLMNIF